MKKIKVILPTFLFSCSFLFGQTRGEYDLDLYQKKLVLTPKIELGSFNGNAPITYGIDADYFVSKTISAQAKFAFGEMNKQEIGGVFMFQNEIRLKKANVYSKSIEQTSKGEVYEVLVTDVGFHRIKGLRGGLYRNSKYDLEVSDAEDIGYAESEITWIQGAQETKYTLSEYNKETSGVAHFNYSTTGIYAGIYLYNSRNSVNVNKETNMMSKGRKNYGFGMTFDVLAGFGNIKSTPTVKIENQKGGFGLGGRMNMEFSYFIGKGHSSAFFTNIEFGKYPKTIGICAIWGLGFRTSFMDKIVSN